MKLLLHSCCGPCSTSVLELLNKYFEENDSINDAYYKMIEAGISKIPIIDNNKKLLGILTMNDIAKEQFSESIDHIASTYQNIINIQVKPLLSIFQSIEP